MKSALGKQLRPLWNWSILTVLDAGSLDDKTDVCSRKDKSRSLCETTFHNTTFSHCSLNPQAYTLVSITLTNCLLGKKNCYGRRICQLCHNQSYVSSYVASHWLAPFQKAEVLSQAYCSDPLNVIQSTAFRVTWIANTSWSWVIGTTVTGPQSDSNGFWMLYLPRWFSLCRIYTQHSWLF